VQAGRNLFLTGAGGTGKSHTIRAIMAWARAVGRRAAVTALTGCAALLLGCGAKTLHSWAGVGLARESPQDLAKAVKRNRRATHRWIDTQLLIIDEISMMTPDFLEKLDLVARRIRCCADRPFGGLQVIFAGDFCQLPPVQKGAGPATSFVFESDTWRSIIQETVVLTQVLRQTDPAFQALLAEVRMGRLSPASIAVLESRKDLPWQENDIRPTLLFTRNAEVDAINRRNLDALDGPVQTYTPITVLKDTAKPGMRLLRPDDPEIAVALERLDADAPYDPALELRTGAQVMLLVNLDQEAGLVNGSRGVVTGFTPGGLPMVRFLARAGSAAMIIDRQHWWLSEHEGIGRSQIPLRVAYAITIHKSQGATLDSALVDIGSSTFEFGQAYVALSRVQTLSGLYVWKLDPRKIQAHPKVVAFYEGLTSTPAASAAAAGDPDPSP
jgi:ATP-dependent DNA helicase PIF1